MATTTTTTIIIIIALMVPWSAEKYLAWDATVVHTCATSYISPQVASVGPASVQAANRKALKYAALPTTHVFQPVAIEINITRGLPEVERFRDSEIPEILGPLDPSACDFINQIGSRMSAITGDRRDTAFLFQRLSIAIQRFNLVAFLGTFPSAIEDEA